MNRKQIDVAGIATAAVSSTGTAPLCTCNEVTVMVIYPIEAIKVWQLTSL